MTRRPRPVSRGPSAAAPKVEELIVRQRIEIVETVLRALHAIPSEMAASVEAKVAAQAKSDDDVAVRQAVAKELEKRWQQRDAMRALIDSHWNVLGALQSDLVPNHGVVERRIRGSGDRVFNFDITPPQMHGLSAGVFASDWTSTVFECVTACPVSGAECVEPAILACIRILRELRELVDDSQAQSADEKVVFNDYGKLRGPARKFLDALSKDIPSLKHVARIMKCDPAHARRFSAPLQRLGFVDVVAEKWVRTPAGDLLLGSA